VEQKMTIRLKSFRLSGVLGLAFLISAFALGNSPARADEAVTPPPGQVATAAPMLPYVSGSVELVSEDDESCTDESQVVAETPTEGDRLSPAIETITEVDASLALVGAAVPVDITQSAAIALPGQVSDDQLPQATDDVDLPVAQTGAAIVVEITQSVTIATPGQIENDHEPVNIAAATFDLPLAQTAAAIVVEVTQTSTIAVPGEIIADGDSVTVAEVFPDEED
jgi:hypothetical protein